MSSSLAPEKRYEVDVRSDDESDIMPSAARFVLTEDDAQEIVRLSALVIVNGLYKVEMFDYRTSWLEGDDPDEFRESVTDSDTLNVSGSEFWFATHLKHTKVEVLTMRQSVRELAEWLEQIQVNRNAERPRGG